MGEGRAHVLTKKDLSKRMPIHQVLVKKMSCWLTFPHAKLTTANRGRKTEIIIIPAIEQNSSYCLSGVTVGVRFFL